ncbi:MAG: glycogen/starch/alpha-glucan phosphorylase [Peptostreptococcaceae bacterium]
MSNLITKTKFKKEFKCKMNGMYAQDISDATSSQSLNVLCSVIKDALSENWIHNQNRSDKEIYYFSAEFLMGKQLITNLINLDILDFVEDTLLEMNINLSDLAQAEKDPGLGNGGLGRLAACFLDSLASLDINGHGYGIRYKYGLFEQKFVNNQQVEIPDRWLTEEGYAWESVRANKAYVVKFGGYVEMVEENNKLEIVLKDYTPVMAVRYDIPIIGYKNKCVNALKLFDSQVISRDFKNKLTYAKAQTGSYQDAMDYKYYAEEISEVLYPNDSNYEGRLLRLRQEYFFTSAGIQDIIRKYKNKGRDIKKIYEKVCIHINDTHPSLCIPEFMRILLDEENLGWDEAFEITTKTISYTNHTILTEAMEKWPKDMVKDLLPRLYMIIEEINKRFIEKLHNDNVSNYDIEKMSIMTDYEVRMANLSIVGSHSVNGVAKLHTELLKKEVLKEFYEYEPEKFNNKTNGIAHRRWLLSCNRELSALISNNIGSEWQKDTQKLVDLEKFMSDTDVLNELEKIKRNNKVKLAQVIKEKYDVDVNPDSIFDSQIKRLHAYKRQLLNAFHILHLYHELLDDPDLDIEPRTFIFAAKAAPGYHFAKCVIKFINSLANKINNDESINGKLKVVFLENYSVTLAEMIIPATDVSEQISTTTKEASGTGNMKFMMNGAITLGTLDGANVEICEQVGRDNMVIFGLSDQQVLDYYKYGGYSAVDLYNSDSKIKRVVDDLINGFIPHIEHEGREIYNHLITYNDEYFVLKDFDKYIKAQQKVDSLYKDRETWNKIMLKNIANSGIFSSDRTIKEYYDDIWTKY